AIQNAPRQFLHGQVLVQFQVAVEDLVAGQHADLDHQRLLIGTLYREARQSCHSTDLDLPAWLPAAILHIANHHPDLRSGEHHVGRLRAKSLGIAFDTLAQTGVQLLNCSREPLGDDALAVAAVAFFGYTHLEPLEAHDWSGRYGSSGQAVLALAAISHCGAG